MLWFNKEREGRGDLRVTAKTVLSVILLVNLLFSLPCRKMRTYNHDIFQLPSRVPGKSWFWFLCQLRPKVAEVSQLFASEARS